MRYETLDDLPYHCQLNLPRAAQHVYKDAWNRAWDESRDRQVSRTRAWQEVRRHFHRDAASGRWVPQPAESNRTSASVAPST